MPLSIEILRERLHSKNWEIACETAEQLGALASQETYQVLIEALASESALTRNSAALTIGNLKLQAAVPLLEAILKPANVNHRGTLVYALTAMDCSHLFSFLFRLALEANYECALAR